MFLFFLQCLLVINLVSYRKFNVYYLPGLLLGRRVGFPCVGFNDVNEKLRGTRSSAEIGAEAYQKLMPLSYRWLRCYVNKSRRSGSGIPGDFVRVSSIPRDCFTNCVNATSIENVS